MVRHRFLIRLAFAFLMLFVVVFLTSCPSMPARYKMYPGPTLPEEQVAILETKKDDFLSTSIQICAVDGVTVAKSSFDGSIKVELLPGEHTIEVKYSKVYSRMGKMYSQESAKVPLTFDVKAGRVYRLFSYRKKNKWRPFISDVTHKGLEHIIPTR